MPLTMFDTELFSTNYATGRQRWLEQLTDLSYPVQYLPYQCAGVGPDGEVLMTDTAWIGAEEAAKVLVIISGTHGIEGFAGNAVELDWLRLLASGIAVMPDDTAVLMIHALTPWGYAWQRRCDADGVDLNRNVVDFSKPLPKNAGYELLRPALFLFDAQQRQAAFAEFEKQHGRDAFERAISAGQYADPAGPFYGGQASAHGRLVTEDLIQRYALKSRDLAVIDVHTGLGSYGYGEIICDHEPDGAAAKVASRWYGASVMLPLLGTSSSVPKTGLLDFAWHSVMNQRSCYITLEFGTYPTHELFEVLLQDHLLWSQADNEEAKRGHRNLMRHHFCPDDKAWQEMVLFRARQVILQALRGVSS
ncbi:MAG: DUF2817 domain-containing protein [Methylovulum sp.]|nr:DUF2817 domain-containing protein [Methylovulum sp.]